MGTDLITAAPGARGPLDYTLRAAPPYSKKSPIWSSSRPSECQSLTLTAPGSTISTSSKSASTSSRDQKRPQFPPLDSRTCLAIASRISGSPEVMWESAR